LGLRAPLAGRRAGMSVIYHQLMYHGEARGTYQEVLEDSVCLGVREELGETNKGSLHDNISDIRVLGEESVGNGNGGKVV
jgi:hypothetical protein